MRYFYLKGLSSLEWKIFVTQYSHHVDSLDTYAIQLLLDPCANKDNDLIDFLFSCNYI